MKRRGFARGICAIPMMIIVTTALAVPSLETSDYQENGTDDTLSHDTIKVDTLHEVTIEGDQLKLAPVMDAINQSLNRNPVPKRYSLSDLLDKAKPGISDHILHPFGFAERKRKKRLKKKDRILQQYDQVDKQKSFNHLLDSVMRLEGLK